MSISIYYTAMRDKPLTPEEDSLVRGLAARYDRQLEDPRKQESFCIYDPAKPSAPNVIFEGATKLSGNMTAAWRNIQHLCQLLSEIRAVVQGAVWQVHVDDHEIIWDEAARAYDPSR